jgi:hypothetical protein
MFLVCGCNADGPMAFFPNDVGCGGHFEFGFALDPSLTSPTALIRSIRTAESNEVRTVSTGYKKYGRLDYLLSLEHEEQKEILAYCSYGGICL